MPWLSKEVLKLVLYDISRLFQRISERINRFGNKFHLNNVIQASFSRNRYWLFYKSLRSLKYYFLSWRKQVFKEIHSFLH